MARTHSTHFRAQQQGTLQRLQQHTSVAYLKLASQPTFTQTKYSNGIRLLNVLNLSWSCPVETRQGIRANNILFCC